MAFSYRFKDISTARYGGEPMVDMYMDLQCHEEELEILRKGHA